jgi:hypothetical protein
MYVCTVPYLPRLYPCTLPTAPVSRSFGLRSSYEIDILDTNQRPRNKSLRLLNQNSHDVFETLDMLAPGPLAAFAFDLRHTLILIARRKATATELPQIGTTSLVQNKDTSYS